MAHGSSYNITVSYRITYEMARFDKLCDSHFVEWTSVNGSGKHASRPPCFRSKDRTQWQTMSPVHPSHTVLLAMIHTVW